MIHINNTLGNILIKHNDRWRGDYYLKEDLTFTLDRSAAARFYFLKSGDTTILNGDRISINCGNKILDIADSIRLIDRDQYHNGTMTFLITNGTDSTDPISFDSLLYLISDKNLKTALKYEWGMDLIVPINNNSIPSAVNYRPHEQPRLINGSYADICPSYINSFEFLLEKADKSHEESQTNTVTLNKPYLSDGYKSAIMIVLLMIVLVLCVIISK